MGITCDQNLKLNTLKQINCKSLLTFFVLNQKLAGFSLEWF